jgi:hypothetical protein
MSDETKESRVKIENLPEQEKELTTDEVKAVKGGAFVTSVETSTLKASDSQPQSETAIKYQKV